MFMKWVNDNQWNPSFCLRVGITPHDGRGYEEFPTARGLRKFDPDDRAFVAAAVAYGGIVEVLQAVDAKWRRWEKALSGAGISVNFLCR
jgi:hypothetical protein